MAFLLAAAALTTAPALAQDGGRWQGRGAGGEVGQPVPPQAQGGPAGGPDRGRPAGAEVRRGDGRWDGARNGRDWDNRAGRFVDGARGGPGANRRPGGWNPGWRDDRRYDWQGWRDGHRSAYRARPYYAPYGYRDGYRRFAVGRPIAPAFFAQDYWIGDPGYYRLPPAAGPYRWVRYYNDALLIDTYSGVVADVIPDFFW